LVEVGSKLNYEKFLIRKMSADDPVEILLVDDRDENLLALEVILANQNYKFVRATSGKDALKILLQEHDFAIILMDVQMPGMDGFETAEVIRQSEKFKRVPIIFLTANSNNQEDVFKGYQTGAVDFMVKPLSAKILRAKVAVFVDLYKKSHELEMQGERMQALNSQLEKQSRYVRSLIEAGLDPLITINKEGKITDMNEALTKITGIERKEITGIYFFDLFTRPDIARQIHEEVYEKGSINDYLLTIRHKGGKLTEVLLNGSVYRDDQGDVTGAVMVAREKLLSKYSRTLIEASLDPLITINSEGKITDMNEALANITGITREKIKGTDFFDYFTDREKAREVYQEAFAKGIVVDSPLTIRHKDGKLTDVLFNGSVYKDERGNVQGIVIVARDITARKKFENELIEAKRNAERAAQIAEEAVKAKQQFLSNMSHEIRTPLNAIIGFTKVVLKTDLTEKQKEYINAIKISGDALIVLINDILDLAKVDAGKMTFEQIPFKPSASIYAMLHLFEPKIKEKKLELKREYDNNIPEVLVGDPVRLHQVVLNLVSNAIKFTSEGSITVSVRLVEEDAKKATLEFSVKDTGIGIPEDKLDTIFDNFQQASSNTSRIYGGTGLGLAIVKQLIVSQGGEVYVKSKQGEGSTFSFKLTYRKTREKILNDKELPVSDGEKNNKGNILVVEDVALNQLLMKTLLEDFGFDMKIAGNGKIALDILKEKEFDLILMDLQMPEMNGFETTEYIRKEMKSDVPIIALTADVTTVDLEKCRKIGMNDYISKPIDEKLLLEKINKHIQRESDQTITMNATGKQELNNDNGNKYTNLDFVKQLTKNNPDMILEMINVYLEETPQLLQRMRTAWQKKDWEELRAAAHAILPSFSTMGFKEEYTEMAKKVQELAIKKEGAEELKEIIEKLETICNKAYEELKEEIVAIK
jgi:PAS domain S-box-containing protein